MPGNHKHALQTEFEFTLPKGYVDAEGTLHCDGVMRLATAMDEIAPLRGICDHDGESARLAMTSGIYNN